VHAGPTHWTHPLGWHTRLTRWADTLWLTLHRTRDGLTMPMSEPCPCPNHAHVRTWRSPPRSWDSATDPMAHPPLPIWRLLRWDRDGPHKLPRRLVNPISTILSPIVPGREGIGHIPPKADFQRHFAELF
jgi:hypothetical protein